jgi:1-acyl-sn-glycerol-3-phosphate acyltransferase
MDRVLPIRSRFPRLFQRIYVYYGEPLEYSDFLERSRSKETAQQLVDRAMETLRKQQARIQELRSRP